MTSLVAQMVKRLPTMRETRVQSLGWEDLLEKEMATHSSTLAWKIPWMEEPGRLQSMGSQRVGHDWATSLSLSYKSVSTMLDEGLTKNIERDGEIGNYKLNEIGTLSMKFKKWNKLDKSERSSDMDHEKWKWKLLSHVLCDLMDYTIHGILQARILEWVAFPFSRGSFQPRDPTQASHIAGRFLTSWATRQAQEYWSG